MLTDSLIFDMDGTLWDAVDSYCEVWREAYRRMGISHVHSREEMLACMGMPFRAIYDRISPLPPESFENFLGVLRQCEAEMMPRLGGRLYPGVKEGLARLRDAGIRLFMVSNCGPHGLDNFVDFTGLRPMFTDLLSQGMTGLDKAGNIQLLCERYSLESPVYVGDIQADCDDTHRAGARMAWVSYGFGRCSDPDYTVDSFDQLTELFLKR